MASYVGYWGHPNSIIDFCEPNYFISHYFAEFFNCLSSIPMVVQALLGLVLTHKYATKQFRYKMCFVSLMLVGIGSSLFHASLKYKYQLLDELPMLILSANTLFCTLTAKSNSRTKNEYYLMLFMMSITAAECVLYIYFQIWSIFFWGYSINVLIITYIVYTVYLKSSPMVRRVFTLGWACYYGGFLCWCADMAFCDYVQALHLHSFWHLGAGYGAYLNFILLIVIRAKYMGRNPKIRILTCKHMLCGKEEEQENLKQILIDIPLVHFCEYKDK